jgi:heat shock protein HtpX
MTPKEVEGVIAHEVAHIANGDMVTMTLLQGIVNAFVMFMARILAQIVSSALNKNSNSNRSPGLIYFALVWVFEIALMILGSMVVAGFSRYREYRADHGGAKLSSKEAMISALQALQRHSNQKSEETPPAIAALQISSKGRIALLFSTHPPLEDRIQALMDL